MTTDRAVAPRRLAARREWPVWTLVVAVTLWLGLRPLTWPANTLDEMILAVYPLRMLGGDLPYQDFFTAYGPTQWWFLTGYIGLAGPGLLELRLLGLIQHCALSLAVAAFARPAGRGWAVTSGALAALLLFRLGDAPYAWTTAAALCLWQVVLLRRTELSVGRVAAAGLLAGLATGIRPDAGLLAVVPALALLRGQGRWRAWALGAGTGLLPVWVTLVLSPTGFVDDIFLGRAGSGAGQSRLPWWPAEPGEQQLLILLVGTLVVGVVCALVTRQRAFVALSLLGLLALGQAFQRLDANHIVYAGLLSIPLLPVLLRELTLRLSRRPAGATVVAGLLGLSLALAGSAEIFQRALAVTVHDPLPRADEVVRHDGRSVPETERRAAALRELLPTVDRLTTPGQSLFVFDADLVRPMITDVTLYYLFPHLRQHGKNLEITPGLTNTPGSGLTEDILGADIIVLVTAPEEFRQALFPFARDGSAEPAAALASTFCKRATIDYYEVYLRCVPR